MWRLEWLDPSRSSELVSTETTAVRSTDGWYQAGAPRMGHHKAPWNIGPLESVITSDPTADDDGKFYDTQLGK